MKLNREKLVEACKAVMSGVVEKEIIPQSSNFIFQNDRIYSFNDEIAVSHPFEVGFEGAVPAKEFLAFISKVKSEQITLKLDKNELLLVGSKAKAGLRLEGISLTLGDIDTPNKWIELPAEFNNAISFCLFSACTDDSKPILQNIHVKGGYVESCDNYRITRYDMGRTASKSFQDELLIPAKAAKDIVSQKPIELGITDGWLHFRNDNGVTFSCRIVDAEYPDFAQFLECTGEEFEFPTTLSEVLGRADVMSDGKKVTVILENDLMTISTENQSGWFEESIEIKYKGKDCEFEILPLFLKSIVKHKGKVVLSEQVLMFDNDNFKHIVKLLSKSK